MPSAVVEGAPSQSDEMPPEPSVHLKPPAGLVGPAGSATLTEGGAPGKPGSSSSTNSGANEPSTTSEPSPARMTATVYVEKRLTPGERVPVDVAVVERVAVAVAVHVGVVDGDARRESVDVIVGVLELVPVELTVAVDVAVARCDGDTGSHAGLTGGGTTPRR